MSWKAVKIGDFLKRSKIPIDIEDSKYYKRVTIRINHNGVSLRDSEIGKKIGTKKQFILKKGQFILSKIDARYGAFGVAPEEVDGAIITGNFWAYDVDESLMNINWLNQYTNSKVFYDLCERASSGITHRKYLNEDFLLNHELLIPEIQEQDSHVFFIKERKDSIGILENENNHQLSLLKKLRQQILQDAVQGKLVPQDPNDEPASILLERIKTEKEQLIREKKIKKGKPLPEVTPEVVPFEIPAKWVWCRLGEICDFISGNNFNSGDFKKGDGVKCIKITNAGVGELIETDDTLPIEFIDKYKSYLVFEDDLVLALTRPYIADGLKISKCPKSYNRSLLNQRVAVIRAKKEINRDFIYYYLKTNYILNVYKSNFEGKGQQPNLKKEHVTELYLPLPPLQEQHRIVTKIDQLMTLCDELEQTIKQNQKYTQELLKVALKEALEPKSVTSHAD